MVTTIKKPRATWSHLRRRGNRLPTRGKAAMRGVHVTTSKEAYELFDYQARKQLGISGEEFLRKWDAGEYRDVQDPAEIQKIQRLTMLMPFARRSTA